MYNCVPQHVTGSKNNTQLEYFLHFVLLPYVRNTHEEAGKTLFEQLPHMRAGRSGASLWGSGKKFPCPKQSWYKRCPNLTYLLETVADDKACSATANNGPDRARGLGRGSARMTEFTLSSLPRSLCT